MKRQRIWLLLILVVGMLLPASYVFSQSSSTTFVVQRFVVGSGKSLESTSFRTAGVVGQPVTDLASSANHNVNGGFLLQRSTVPTAVSISTISNSATVPFGLIVTTASLLFIAAIHLHRRQSWYLHRGTSRRALASP